MKNDFSIKEKAGLSKYEDKKSFIRTLSYFLLTTSQFKPLQHFLFIISNLQYLAIVMYFEKEALFSAPKTGLTYCVQKVVEMFVLNDIFQDNYTKWVYSFLLIWTWLYLFSFLLIFVLLGIKTFKQIRFIYIRRSFLENLFQFHLSGLFWIVNIILFIPFSSLAQDRVTTLGFNRKDFIILFFNGFGLLLNYVIGIILALFCTDPFKSKREYSTYTSISQIFLFLSKAIFAPLVVFLNKYNEGVIDTMNALGLMLSLVQLYILLKFMPFYFPRTMKNAVSWNFTWIWIGIVNVFGSAFSSSPTSKTLSGIIYLKLLGIPFCVKVARELFIMLAKHHMTKNMEDSTSEEAVFKKLLSFSLVSENMIASMNVDTKINEYEVYFFGDLVFHSQSCQDSDCICNIKVEPEKNLTKSPRIKEKLEIYKEKRASEILNAGIERIKNNNRLKLAYAHLLLEGENIRLSSILAYIYGISKNSFQPGWFSINTRKFLLFKLAERKLNLFLDPNNNDGVLDMKAYLDFHIAKTNLKGLLLSNSQKFHDFWSYYREPNFKMINLYRKSRVIELGSERLERLWNVYMNKYPHFYNILGEYYCIYQTIIRNMPYYAYKTSKKYAWKLKNSNFEAQKLSAITEANIILSDTITFYISMTKEKIGKIQYVSSNIENVLGFTSEELTGKNISTLMPISFTKEHDLILSRHLQQTKTLDRKSFSRVSGYVKNQKGFYLPMSTYTTIFPYIQKELTYLGVLRTCESSYEQIQLTNSGYVDAFTEKIGRMLDLSFEKIIHISEICPDLSIKSTKKTFKLVSLISKTSEVLTDKETNPIMKKSYSNHRKFSQKEEDSEQTEEFDWKSFSFTPYKNWRRDDLRKGPEQKEISFEIKITYKTYFNKKYPILLFRRDTNFENMKRNLIIEYNESSKRFTKRKDFDETDPDIPMERPQRPYDPLKSSKSNLMSYEGLPLSPTLVSEIYPAETETGLLSPERRNKLAENAQNSKSDELTEQLGSPIKKVDDDSPDGKSPFATLNNLGKNPNYNFTLAVKSTAKEEELLKTSQRNQNSSIDLNTNEKVQRKLSEKASSVYSNGVNPKVEQAVYSTSRDRVAWNSFYAVSFFFVLCIGLITGFTIYGNHLLEHVRGNITILNLSSLRLGEILFVDRYAEIITLLRTGLIEDNRFFYAFQSTIKKTLPRDMYADLNFMRFINNRLRNSLNQTKIDLFNEINQWKVPLTWKEDSPPVLKNNFDAINEIIMRGLTARHTSTIFDQPNENVDFILNNSMNDLLITTEGLTNVFIQDNEYKLKNLETIVLVFILIVVCFGVVFIALLISQQKKFIKGRDAFIEALLRINDHEIAFTQNRTKLFLSILTKKDTKIETLKNMNLNFNLSKGILLAKSQNKITSKRETNMRNINKNQFFIFGLGLLLFIVFLIPFIHLSFLIEGSVSDIRQKFISYIDSNDGLYQILLLASTYYSYIRTDGTSKIRNNPIKDEWNKIFKKVSDSQANLLNVLIYYQKENTCAGSTRTTLEHLIRGNLCTAYPLRSLASLCPSFSPSLLANGIQGLNSFSVSTLNSLKKQYDGSPRGHMDAFNALSQPDIVTMDLMIATFQSTGYISLQTTLQNCMLETIITREGDLVELLIIYISGLVVIIPIILYFFIKKMNKERVEWRKVFRKIPTEIIMTNKILKYHLVKENNFAMQI